MKVECLATGYALAEAPRPDGSGGCYFSDVAGGGVFHLSAAGEIRVVVPRRRSVNGIALHTDGGIVITGRDVSHVRDGFSRVLLRREATVFGDLCCDAEGSVIVGATRADPLHTDRFVGEALRIAAPHSAEPLYGDLFIPNGVALSPDGTRLYHADSARRVVFAHARNAAGSWGDRHVLADLTAGAPPDFSYPPALPTPDGLAVDELGGVWVAIAGAGRLQRYAPDGRADVALELPARRVTSLAFGGGDRRDLWVTSADDPGDPNVRGGLFRTRASQPGLAVALARV